MFNFCFKWIYTCICCLFYSFRFTLISCTYKNSANFGNDTNFTDKCETPLSIRHIWKVVCVCVCCNFRIINKFTRCTLSFSSSLETHTAYNGGVTLMMLGNRKICHSFEIIFNLHCFKKIAETISTIWVNTLCMLRWWWVNFFF